MLSDPSFYFSRQGSSVALVPVLELALIDQAGLELNRDPPASGVLGLKACTTTAQLVRPFLTFESQG